MRRSAAGHYVVAGVAGMLMALAAGAADSRPPMTCTTVPGHTINVLQMCNTNCSETGEGQPLGPAGPLVCAASGDCTGVEYEITGTPAQAYVAAMVRGGGVLAGHPIFQPIVTPCLGDSLTGLGRLVCDEQAVRLQAETGATATTRRYKIIVQGAGKQAVDSTIAVRSTTTQVGSCKIAGLGSTGAPLDAAAQVIKIETRVFKGCAVKFTLDTATSNVLTVENDPANSDFPTCPADGDCCSPVMTKNVEELEVTLDGVPIGSAAFIPDFTQISSGSNSCTSLVIGGRVYTWGDPCPE